MNIISSSLLQVDPYPHTFTSKLKPVNCVEKDTVEFEITTEAADAEVTWFNGNKKIVADGERIIEVVEVKHSEVCNVLYLLYQGTKRKLVINNAEMKDSGDISAKTNKDKSTAPLNVGILNSITKEVTSDAFRSISGMVFAVEREELVLYVSVKDPNAPVYFYINGQKIDDGSFR